MDRKSLARYIIIFSSPAVILLAIVVSICLGSTDIQIKEVYRAIFAFDPENVQQTIVRTSRLPRAAGSLLIGMLLAISGAIMQGMTRNYLASPSIMGVSDGAAFVITIALISLPHLSSLEMLLLSFIGSIIGIALVFGLAACIRNGFSPVRLAIIGTVIGTFLSSLSQALASYYQVSQTMSFWYNARLHQINSELLLYSFPIACVGMIMALLLAKSITILSLGKETATGLGQKTWQIQILTIISVGLMTGVGVALAGKIAFVGLIIPHIVRFLVGVDYKWIIPCSGIIGGVFLVVCDVISRFVHYSFETPIGVVTTLVGIPFFLYLIKKKGGGQHQTERAY